MFKRIAIVFCLFVLQVFWGMGQRVISTIDPNAGVELGEGVLRFDSNWMPVSQNTIDQNNQAAQSYGKVIDLNFCPNVVFTPDSNRGFVSYTGSDKVMVFNPKTAEIISLIDVPSNPGQMVLSPDGTKVFFPCHYLDELVPDAHNHDPLIGGVSYIDTETLELTSVEFGDVAIGFYNNILFSDDGSFLFISSIRTDEMLMLDSETLAEVSPRLKFTPGTRPASMKRIPGTNRAAVVLVGSDNLNRKIYPDSLAIVDLDSFELLKTIFPVVSEDSVDDSLLVDFTATTTLAFSDDGKWGAIADQELTSMSPLPELGADRLWILDVENEVFVDYVYCSGMSGSTYWVPSIGEFVTVGAMGLLFVDPVEGLIEGTANPPRKITPSRSDFRARSSLEILDDNRSVMVPSPSYDSLMVIDYVEDITMRGVVIGGLFIRDPSATKDCNLCVDCVEGCNDACDLVWEESDQEDDDYEVYTECISDCTDECESVCEDCEYLMEGPMQITYTPDHTMFAVVSFNKNVVYMVKDTYHFPVTKFWLNSNDYFTGVALINNTDKDAELWGAAYNSHGIVLIDDSNTDGVEYANPIMVDLPAGTQKTFVAEELLEPLTHDAFTGWIDMDSDQNGVTALMLYGDHKLKSLDGLTSNPRGYKRLIYPDIRVDGTKVNGELNILNTNLKAGDIKISLYNEFGGNVSTYSYSVPTKSFYSVMLKDVDTTDDTDSGLFPEGIWNNFNYGYIEVVTEEGSLQGFQRGVEKNKLSLLGAWGEGSPESLATKFYVPTVVTLQGAQAWINIINSNYSDGEDDDGDGEKDDLDDENMWVTIRFWTDYGATYSQSLVLVERNSFRIELADLFNLYETGDFASGWLEISANRAGLVGNVELRLTDANMTQIPFQALNSREFLLGHVAEGYGLETGIALVNPSDQDVLVTMQVHDSDGNVTGEAQFSVPALTHISQLLKEYIPDFGDQVGGYIKIVSSGEIVALELFYKQDLEYVASVIPQ